MRRWAEVDARSLSIYRVLFAGAVLLMFPDFTWIRHFPDALYAPPPGPMRLFGGFPPTAALVALTAAVALCAACLLLGVKVRAASWLLTGCLAYGYGLSNSLGKIDHNLLLVLTPAVLALAGWAPGARVRPWVLQLWAFTIGVAMLTAAIPKLMAGWLNPTSHAVRGLVSQQVYTYGQDTPSAVLASHLTAGWVWEPADWVTPLLEASIVILAVLGLRWFRAGLGLLALFHLGVLLTMTIAFAPSVVTYGAFVAWPVPRWAPAWSARARWLLVVPVAVGAFALSRVLPDPQPATVVLGAAVAVAALVRTGQAARTNSRKPPVAEATNVAAGAVAGSAPVATPDDCSLVYAVPPAVE